MSEQKLFNLKKTGIVVLAAGLFIFLVYLYFVGLNEVIDNIRKADPFFYSSALASMFLSTVFYSLTWQRLLNVLSVKSSFSKAFQFVWVGSFVDILVPAESISGDISKVYLMTNESGENAGKVVASVIGHRVLSMTITLGGLIVSSIYFIINYRPSMLVVEFVGVIGIGTLVSLILIFYLSKNRQVTDRVVNWLIGVLVRLSRGHWKFEGLKQQAAKMLKAFHDGIDSLSVRPRILALPIVLSVLAWMLDLLIAVFVFRAINAHVAFAAIAIVYSITTAFQTIPIGVPGEVGVLDIIMATLYTALGIPPAFALAATILIRGLTLWVRLLVGGITVQWLGIKGLKAPTLPQ
jgi:hypothetical protein